MSGKILISLLIFMKSVLSQITSLTPENIPITLPFYRKCNDETFKILEETEQHMTTTSDRLLYASIYLGSNSQKFEVIIDSGSSILWVPNIYCTECHHNKYNPMKSKTFQTEYKKRVISYGSGEVSGYDARDTISLAPNGHEFFLNFMLVSKSTLTGISGIIGLPYQNKVDKFSLLNQLKGQGIIKSKIFSQKYISRNEGEFLIGQYPKLDMKDSRLGSCSLHKLYKDLSNNSFFECTMDGFMINDENSFSRIDTDVIFDTGTNFIVLIKSVFNKIIDSYFEAAIREGSCFIATNIYIEVNCKLDFDVDSIGTLILVFNKWGISLNPQHLYVNTGSNLKFQMKGLLDNIGDNIFGEPILFQMVSIFNIDDDKFEFYGRSVMLLSRDYTNHFKWWVILIIVVSGIVFLAVLFALIKKFCFKKKEINIENETGASSLDSQRSRMIQ